MKNIIAYIDDNRENLDCISLILKKDFEVETFQKPDSFLNKFGSSNYSAILMDIHMPHTDGFSLYEKVIQKETYNGCPIIFISSDDSDTARIQSFTLGAVDFLSRIMRPDEMLARVKSKILFYLKHRSIIEFGNLRVNLTLLKTYINNEELKLTFIEFKLLCHALRRYPEPIFKEELVEQVWNNGHVLDATFYTHISNLNSKLVSWDHELISTRGKGMQLVKK